MLQVNSVDIDNVDIISCRILVSVCTNNNLNDIRKIYDFDEYASRTFEFLWNLIVPPTPAPAPAPSETRNKYDPNQLLGSDCTLSV